MAPLGFAKNRSKIPACERESLLDSPRHRQLRASAWDAVLPGKNPHAASTVVDLKGASSESTVGVDHASGNGDFPAGIATRIAVDSRNTHPRRTPGKKKSSDGNKKDKNESIMFCHLRLLHRNQTQK